MNSDLKKLIEDIKLFTAERNWSNYHSPKNLAMALSKETAEIVEIFQWLTQEESKNLNEGDKIHLTQEIGDVMIYLTNLASKFNIDPIEAAFLKMKSNRTKYPPELFNGNFR